MTVERYFYASGLRRLEGQLHGDEHVLVEARHGGVMKGVFPLIVYPILLARALRARAIEPRFRYTITLNDWEPDTPERTLGHALNPAPRGGTLQYQPDAKGCHATEADHRKAALEQELAPVREALPQGEVEVVRTSSLRNEPDFLTLLRFALERPRRVREIAQQTLGIEALEKPLQFAGAVCRRCRSIEGSTDYVEGWDRVHYRCAACGNEQEADIRELDYWADARLLDVAKNAVLKPRVGVFGGDLLQGRTVDFHTALHERALGRPLDQAYLVTPVLVGPDTSKKGPPHGNITQVPLTRLLAVGEVWDGAEIALDKM